MLILLVSCVVFSLHAQENMIQKRGKWYVYQREVYKCSELGDIYQNYKPALDLYSAGMQDRKKSKLLAWSGLGLLAGGVWMTNDVRNSSFSNGNIPVIKIVLGLAGLAGGFALEIAAIATIDQGSDRIEMARDVFNLEMRRIHGYKTQGSVSLAFISNGVGFVVNF